MQTNDPDHSGNLRSITSLCFRSEDNIATDRAWSGSTDEFRQIYSLVIVFTKHEWRLVGVSLGGLLVKI